MTRAPLVLVVFNQDVQDEPKSSAPREEEANHRNPRIAKDLERCVDLHKQGSAYNQRRQDQAGGDAVCHLLKPRHQVLCIRRPHFHLHLRVCEGIEHFGDPRRETRHKVPQLQYGTKQLARGSLLPHFLAEQLAHASPHGSVGVELRREYPSYLVELKESFPDEGQLRWNIKPRFGAGFTYSQQCLPNIHLLYRAILLLRDQAGNLSPEFALIKFFCCFAHGQDQFQSLLRLPFADSEEQLQEVLLLAGCRPAYHAEIQQRYFVIIG